MNKEKFTFNGGVLYLGDCLDVLDEIEDESVDLILTDPPYAISSGVVIDWRPNNGSSYYVAADFGDWDKFSSGQEFWRFQEQWISKAMRKLKKGGHIVCFIDIWKVSYLADLISKYGGVKRQVLFWRKTNPMVRLRKVDFLQSIESAVWMSKESKERKHSTFNYELGLEQCIIEAAVPGLTKLEPRLHPTQKPVTVLKKWIAYLSNEGDLVLDPFAGSGSTLIAADELDRRWIGIEKDKEHFEKAKQWLTDRLSQGRFIFEWS